MALPWTVWADDIYLVRVGELWRFTAGAMAPSDPISQWRQLGFKDDLWLQGHSGFSYVYGDAATWLSDAQPGVTPIYMRRKFTVTDPASVQWLFLRADYQDGFIAYLNGAEIARRGVPGEPGSPVSADAIPPHPPGAAEEIDVSTYARLLIPGENVLAIEGRRAFPDNLGFVIIPELLANFTRGPFVQNSSTNRVQIIWKTLAASDTEVDYGPTLALTNRYLATNYVSSHVATLTNLAPDTTYYYQARSAVGGKLARSPVYNFHTLKISGPLSFVVVGDTGYGSQAQYQMAEVIKSAAPDLVVHDGDVIYPTLTAGRLDLKCFSVYQPQMRGTPFFFILGNHDRYDNPFDFLAAFNLPTNTVTGTSHYYSFDHGDAHFVALDTDLRLDNGWSTNGPQYHWLEQDLAATAKPWRFLFFHMPIRSSGPHRIDDYNLNGIPDRLEFQSTIGVLASRYGVQVIFNAHDHLYERLKPVEGVHTIVTGGGGAVLYGFGGEFDAASAQFWSRYNCVKVKIQGETLELQALGLNGEVFDSMTIQRALPKPQTYLANWNSPVVESGPANDNDGNITGQTFNLTGTPIPTLPGRFSNLGRCYVNNDSNTLFIGFEQVMIYSNNNVFLFIESPRLPGVTNLLNVGNGIVDPDGRGADGLDFLANLSFTNFAPAIGCILGDEFGDGQTRNFARPGLDLNIGQGAYYLAPALPDVPGLRLQQFNRSPQNGPVFGEQNADFIEVAIPLSSLGGLQPGDNIKLGAVTGGGAFDTNLDRQIRQLDTSFMGYSLRGSGQGPVVLDGLSVRLATNSIAWSLDADADGLPDAWEIAHGLNPYTATGQDGPNGDPDGDGLSNKAEFLAGTDPRDPSSNLRLSIQWFSTTQITISWTAIIGKKYQLEWADRPASGFSPVPDPSFPRTATDFKESYTLTLAQALSQSATRYYRIRLVP